MLLTTGELSPNYILLLVSEHHIEQEIEYVKRTYNPCDLRVIAFKRLTGTHLVCIYIYVCRRVAVDQSNCSQRAAGVRRHPCGLSLDVPNLAQDAHNIC